MPAVNIPILGLIEGGVPAIWPGSSTSLLFKLIDKMIELRIAEEAEREDLDTAAHSELAYNM